MKTSVPILQIVRDGQFLQIDWLSRNFSSEIASANFCKIGFGYTRLGSNCESFPANYRIILQAAKVFYLNTVAYPEVSAYQGT